MDPQTATALVPAAKALGAGIAVIALAGVGIGIGNIFSSLVSSIARNPSARDQVFGLGILGFALTEAVALFALLIAFLILFT
jgi:F-type H+-transporting ATPase subunit c